MNEKKRAKCIGEIVNSEDAEDVLRIALSVTLQKAIIDAYNSYVTAFNDGLSKGRRSNND